VEPEHVWGLLPESLENARLKLFRDAKNNVLALEKRRHAVDADAAELIPYALEASAADSEELDSSRLEEPQNNDDKDGGGLWTARLLLIGASALYGTNFASGQLLRLLIR
jgi:hypothetical protein